jgi:hypothetical protein
MNKHILSTIAAAMVPIGMSSASVQPPSAYSYLGSRNNKNTTYATNISIADGTNETYTVNGWTNTNNAVTDNVTFNFNSGCEQ